MISFYIADVFASLPPHYHRFILQVIYIFPKQFFYLFRVYLSKCKLFWQGQQGVSLAFAIYCSFVPRGPVHSSTFPFIFYNGWRKKANLVSKKSAGRQDASYAWCHAHRPRSLFLKKEIVQFGRFSGQELCNFSR